MIAPRFLELAREYEGRAVFLKVNVQTARGAADNIRSMPTFRFFSNGKKKHEFAGGDEGQMRRLTQEMANHARKHPNPVMEVKTRSVFKKLLRDAQSLPVVVAFVEKDNDDCKQAYTFFKDLNKKSQGRAVFAKVYPSDNLPTAELCGVSKSDVPIFQVYTSGKKVDEVVGVNDSALKEKVDAAIAAREAARAQKSNKKGGGGAKAEPCPEVKPEPTPKRPEERSALRLALAPLRPEKVVIIGAGPAGLSAALYAARAGLAPLVIAPQEGGQLTFTKEVENYPTLIDGTGPKLLDLMRVQAETFDTEFEATKVIDVDLTHHPFTITTNLSKHSVIKTLTLIIATGADARWLDVAGESTYRAKGISSCATCDGYLFKDKDVLVIGGGDTAMEEALFLSRVCKSVTVVHRRDSFRASYILQRRVLEHPKIKVLWNYKVKEFKGGDYLTHTLLEEVNTGEELELESAATFIAIGHIPNTDLFVNKIEMESTGYLITKGTSTATSVEGVFAAGDVADAIYRQAVTSAGSGAMSALDVERWLNEHGDVDDAGDLTDLSGLDLSSWNMKMIKAVMKDQGVSSKGCVEKKDFIERLRSSTSSSSNS
jgi:thioredoxin reductase (NADPH)